MCYSSNRKLTQSFLLVLVYNVSVWQYVDVSKTVQTPGNIVYHMLKLMSDFALHLLLKDSLYLMSIKKIVCRTLREHTIIRQAFFLSTYYEKDTGILKMNYINIAKQKFPSSRSSKESYKWMNIYNRVESAFIGSKEEGISSGSEEYTREMVKSSRGDMSLEKSEAQLSQVTLWSGH